MKTFYRFQRFGAPCLCADHAYSAPWHARFVSPSEYTCELCDGEGDFGEDENGRRIVCESCNGEGTIQAQRGYSCFDSREAVETYIAEHGFQGDGEIVAFPGIEQPYFGDDFELLAVPA